MLTSVAKLASALLPAFVLGFSVDQQPKLKQNYTRPDSDYLGNVNCSVS